MKTSSLGMYTKAELFEHMTHHEWVQARNAQPRQRAGWHEAYAIMLEEVEEVWALVKAVKPGSERPAEYLALAGELKQVAAMAMRFALECIPDEYLVEASAPSRPWQSPELRATLRSAGFVGPARLPDQMPPVTAY